MTVLALEGVTIKFGGLTAVQDVSFNINRGEIVSVIGPNGAGKTSLFNAVTGIYHPSNGTILFNGAPIKKEFSDGTKLKLLVAALSGALGALLLVNAQNLFQGAVIDHYHYLQPFPWSEAAGSLARVITETSPVLTLLPALLGFLCTGLAAFVFWARGSRGSNVVASFGLSRTFQNIRLFNELSVLDNVRVSLDRSQHTTIFDCALRTPRFRAEHRAQTKAARAILEFVGLDHVEHRGATTLSYGDQRRLEIARALAARPEVLLLDEPAAGMNPTEAARLMELIKKIRDRGVTILLIEHHMKVVMGISDRVVVLNYGNKIAEGSPAEVSSNPLVIEAYLGAKPQR